MYKSLTNMKMKEKPNLSIHCTRIYHAVALCILTCQWVQNTENIFLPESVWGYTVTQMANHPSPAQTGELENVIVASWCDFNLWLLGTSILRHCHYILSGNWKLKLHVFIFLLFRVYVCVYYFWLELWVIYPWCKAQFVSKVSFLLF